MENSEKPQLNFEKNSYGERKTFSHPAFGLIEVSRPSSNPGATLFGSDLQHQHYISVRVKTARLIRDLHTDWHFPEKTLLEFNLSEAQWANFVSGAGRSQATPVTLSYIIDENGPSHVPSIEKPEESRKDSFDKEFQLKLDEAISQFKSSVNQLLELSNQKTISKVKLKEIVTTLSYRLSNLPSNLNFTVERFKEVSETTVEEAKAEIESYLAHAVYSAGVKSIQDENKGNFNPPQLPSI